MTEDTRIGVAAFLNKDNHIFLLKRKSNLGTGTWGLPGGKPDFGEWPVQTAVRETKEETGLDIVFARFQPKDYSSAVFEGHHYITILYYVDLWPDEHPRLMEPEKFSDSMFWNLTGPIPTPIFPPLASWFEIHNIAELWRRNNGNNSRS